MFARSAQPYVVTFAPGVTTKSTEDVPVTVTAHVAFFVVSAVDVAVIVALPDATAVTVPPETVATLSSLEVHVTVVAMSSDVADTVAVKVEALPARSVSDVLSNVTDETPLVAVVTSVVVDDVPLPVVCVVVFSVSVCAVVVFPVPVCAVVVFPVPVCAVVVFPVPVCVVVCDSSSLLVSVPDVSPLEHDEARSSAAANVSDHTSSVIFFIN